MSSPHSSEPSASRASDSLDSLRRQLPEIAALWREALHRALPSTRASASLPARSPSFLTAFLEAVSSSAWNDDRTAHLLFLAHEHGRACGLADDVTVDQLTTELRLLRRVLRDQPEWEQLHDRSHELLDLCMEQAVLGFTEARTPEAQAEQASRQLAELETIIASAPEAIYVGTFDGITHCNQAALDMLGFSSAEEVNQNIARLNDLVQNRDPETHELLAPEELPFVQALQGRVSIRDTEVIHRKSGERRIIRGRAAPILVDGEVTGAVAINSDITLERQREAELAEALRMRDELLSMASHELRTPLSALLLQLQLMQRHVNRRSDHSLSAEEVARSLPQATRIARRLSEMLDRLLDLSRVRTDHFGLEINAFDLRSVMHDLVAHLRPQAHEAGSDIEERLGEEEVFVYADPLRIEQVLTNLVTNAIKYGNQKPITVRLSRRHDDAIIEVQDRGIGISEQDQKRIFERFERATDAQRSNSLGLGLYITREIVRAHGGTIEVRSEPGQGSTFVVTLPTQRMP